jgi:plasmid stability protein
MSALSIRDLDDKVKERLRIRAARHGRSMEAEVRAILTDAVAEIRYRLERLSDGRRKQNLLIAATEIFAAFGDYILPFDAGAATWYATIVAPRSTGHAHRRFDAQIAAICRIRTATLATRNTKDFRETGIDVIDPWQQKLTRPISA